jgi:hypothetical protein
MMAAPAGAIGLRDDAHHLMPGSRQRFELLEQRNPGCPKNTIRRGALGVTIFQRAPSCGSS